MGPDIFTEQSPVKFKSGPIVVIVDKPEFITHRCYA